MELQQALLAIFIIPMFVFMLLIFADFIFF